MEKAALVEKEPSYGRVICRCETVTQGEILAALHGPIPPCSVEDHPAYPGSLALVQQVILPPAGGDGEIVRGRHVVDNVRGVELAKGLCQRLDVPYRSCGSFVLALSEEDRFKLTNGLPRGIITKEKYNLPV